MTSTPHLQPREGDIVRTLDGHLWRVTSIHDGVEHVAAISRLGDHIEMAARPGDLTVIEPHPGGAR